MDRPTESKPKMIPLEVIFMRSNASVCLPLTVLVIILVFCLVKREQTPLIYYINLLVSNIIQFIVIFIYVKHGKETLITDIIEIVCVMARVYLRMIIAMERCFVITRPQWNWIRQTGKSVLVSVLVWILCITTLSPCMVFDQFVPVLVVILLPAPLFIFFSAWTFKALPAATSVPTDEKRRIVGTLVLLFIQYFLIFIFLIWFLVFFYLIPYVDLILSYFLRKGPIDKLLSCLCCCIKEKTAEDVVGHQHLHELMLQQEEKDELNQTV